MKFIGTTEMIGTVTKSVLLRSIIFGHVADVGRTKIKKLDIDTLEIKEEEVRDPVTNEIREFKVTDVKNAIKSVDILQKQGSFDDIRFIYTSKNIDLSNVNFIGTIEMIGTVTKSVLLRSIIFGHVADVGKPKLESVDIDKNGLVWIPLKHNLRAEEVAKTLSDVAQLKREKGILYDNLFDDIRYLYSTADSDLMDVEFIGNSQKIGDITISALFRGIIFWEVSSIGKKESDVLDIDTAVLKSETLDKELTIPDVAKNLRNAALFKQKDGFKFIWVLYEDMQNVQFRGTTKAIGAENVEISKLFRAITFSLIKDIDNQKVVGINVATGKTKDMLLPEPVTMDTLMNNLQIQVELKEKVFDEIRELYGLERVPYRGDKNLSPRLRQIMADIADHIGIAEDDWFATVDEYMMALLLVVELKSRLELEPGLIKFLRGKIHLATDYRHYEDQDSDLVWLFNMTQTLKLAQGSQISIEESIDTYIEVLRKAKQLWESGQIRDLLGHEVSINHKKGMFAYEINAGVVSLQYYDAMTEGIVPSGTFLRELGTAKLSITLVGETPLEQARYYSDLNVLKYSNTIVNVSERTGFDSQKEKVIRRVVFAGTDANGFRKLWEETQVYDITSGRLEQQTRGNLTTVYEYENEGYYNNTGRFVPVASRGKTYIQGTGIVVSEFKNRIDYDNLLVEQWVVHNNGNQQARVVHQSLDMITGAVIEAYEGDYNGIANLEQDSFYTLSSNFTPRKYIVNAYTNAQHKILGRASFSETYAVTDGTLGSRLSYSEYAGISAEGGSIYNVFDEVANFGHKDVLDYMGRLRESWQDTDNDGIFNKVVLSNYDNNYYLAFNTATRLDEYLCDQAGNKTSTRLKHAGFVGYNEYSGASYYWKNDITGFSNLKINDAYGRIQRIYDGETVEVTVAVGASTAINADDIDYSLINDQVIQIKHIQAEDVAYLHYENEYYKTRGIASKTQRYIWHTQLQESQQDELIDETITQELTPNGELRTLVTNRNIGVTEEVLYNLSEDQISEIITHTKQGLITTAITYNQLGVETSTLKHNAAGNILAQTATRLNIQGLPVDEQGDRVYKKLYRNKIYLEGAFNIKNSQGQLVKYEIDEILGYRGRVHWTKDSYNIVTQAIQFVPGMALAINWVEYYEDSTIGRVDLYTGVLDTQKNKLPLMNNDGHLHIQRTSQFLKVKDKNTQQINPYVIDEYRDGLGVVWQTEDSYHIVAQTKEFIPGLNIVTAWDEYIQDVNTQSKDKVLECNIQVNAFSGLPVLTSEGLLQVHKKNTVLNFKDNSGNIKAYELDEQVGIRGDVWQSQDSYGVSTATQAMIPGLLIVGNWHESVGTKRINEGWIDTDSRGLPILDQDARLSRHKKSQVLKVKDNLSGQVIPYQIDEQVGIRGEVWYSQDSAHKIVETIDVTPLLNVVTQWTEYYEDNIIGKIATMQGNIDRKANGVPIIEQGALNVHLTDLILKIESKDKNNNLLPYRMDQLQGAGGTVWQSKDSYGIVTQGLSFAPGIGTTTKWKTFTDNGYPLTTGRMKTDPWGLPIVDTQANFQSQITDHVLPGHQWTEWMNILGQLIKKQDEGIETINESFVPAKNLAVHSYVLKDGINLYNLELSVNSQYLPVYDPDGLLNISGEDLSFPGHAWKGFLTTQGRQMKRIEEDGLLTLNTAFVPGTTRAIATEIWAEDTKLRQINMQVNHAQRPVIEDKKLSVIVDDLPNTLSWREKYNYRGEMQNKLFGNFEDKISEYIPGTYIRKKSELFDQYRGRLGTYEFEKSVNNRQALIYKVTPVITDDSGREITGKEYEIEYLTDTSLNRLLMKAKEIGWDNYKILIDTHQDWSDRWLTGQLQYKNPDTGVYEKKMDYYYPSQDVNDFSPIFIENLAILQSSIEHMRESIEKSLKRQELLKKQDQMLAEGIIEVKKLLERYHNQLLPLVLKRAFGFEPDDLRLLEPEIVDDPSLVSRAIKIKEYLQKRLNEIIAEDKARLEYIRPQIQQQSEYLYGLLSGKLIELLFEKDGILAQVEIARRQISMQGKSQLSLEESKLKYLSELIIKFSEITLVNFKTDKEARLEASLMAQITELVKGDVVLKRLWEEIISVKREIDQKKHELQRIDAELLGIHKQKLSQDQGYLINQDREKSLMRQRDRLLDSLGGNVNKFLQGEIGDFWLKTYEQGKEYYELAQTTTVARQPRHSFKRLFKRMTLEKDEFLPFIGEKIGLISEWQMVLALKYKQAGEVEYRRLIAEKIADDRARQLEERRQKEKIGLYGHSLVITALDIRADIFNSAYLDSSTQNAAQWLKVQKSLLTDVENNQKEIEIQIEQQLRTNPELKLVWDALKNKEKQTYQDVKNYSAQKSVLAVYTERYINSQQIQESVQATTDMLKHIYQEQLKGKRYLRQTIFNGPGATKENIELFLFDPEDYYESSGLFGAYSGTARAYTYPMALIIDYMLKHPGLNPDFKPKDKIRKAFDFYADQIDLQEVTIDKFSGLYNMYWAAFGVLGDPTINVTANAYVLSDLVKFLNQEYGKDKIQTVINKSQSNQPLTDIDKQILSYLKLAHYLAEYIISLQDEDGGIHNVQIKKIPGGIYKNILMKEKITTDNCYSYKAIKDYGEFLKDQNIAYPEQKAASIIWPARDYNFYQNSGAKIKQWIDQKMFNGERFYAGIHEDGTIDYGVSTEAQLMGYLILREDGLEDEKKYFSAIKYVLNNLVLKDSVTLFDVPVIDDWAWNDIMRWWNTLGLDGVGFGRNYYSEQDVKKLTKYHQALIKNDVAVLNAEDYKLNEMERKIKAHRLNGKIKAIIKMIKETNLLRSLEQDKVLYQALLDNNENILTAEKFKLTKEEKIKEAGKLEKEIKDKERNIRMYKSLVNDNGQLKKSDELGLWPLETPSYHYLLSETMEKGKKKKPPVSYRLTAELSYALSLHSKVPKLPAEEAAQATKDYKYFMHELEKTVSPSFSITQEKGAEKKALKYGQPNCNRWGWDYYGVLQIEHNKGLNRDSTIWWLMAKEEGNYIEKKKHWTTSKLAWLGISSFAVSIFALTAVLHYILRRNDQSRNEFDPRFSSGSGESPEEKVFPDEFQTTDDYPSPDKPSSKISALGLFITTVFTSGLGVLGILLAGSSQEPGTAVLFILSGIVFLFGLPFAFILWSTHLVGIGVDDTNNPDPELKAIVDNSLAAKKAAEIKYVTSKYLGRFIPAQVDQNKKILYINKLWVVSSSGGFLTWLRKIILPIILAHELEHLSQSKPASNFFHKLKSEIPAYLKMLFAGIFTRPKKLSPPVPDPTGGVTPSFEVSEGYHEVLTLAQARKLVEREVKTVINSLPGENFTTVKKDELIDNILNGPIMLILEKALTTGISENVLGLSDSEQIVMPFTPEDIKKLVIKTVDDYGEYLFTKDGAKLHVDILVKSIKLDKKDAAEKGYLPYNERRVLVVEDEKPVRLPLLRAVYFYLAQDYGQAYVEYKRALIRNPDSKIIQDLMRVFLRTNSNRMRLIEYELIEKLSALYNTWIENTLKKEGMPKFNWPVEVMDKIDAVGKTDDPNTNHVRLNNHKIIQKRIKESVRFWAIRNWNFKQTKAFFGLRKLKNELVTLKLLLQDKFFIQITGAFSCIVALSFGWGIVIYLGLDPVGLGNSVMNSLLAFDWQSGFIKITQNWWSIPLIFTTIIGLINYKADSRLSNVIDLFTGMSLWLLPLVVIFLFAPSLSVPVIVKFFISLPPIVNWGLVIISGILFYKLPNMISLPRYDQATAGIEKVAASFLHGVVNRVLMILATLGPMVIFIHAAATLDFSSIPFLEKVPEINSFITSNIISISDTLKIIFGTGLIGFLWTIKPRIIKPKIKEVDLFELVRYQTYYSLVSSRMGNLQSTKEMVLYLTNKMIEDKVALKDVEDYVYRFWMLPEQFGGLDDHDRGIVGALRMLKKTLELNNPQKTHKSVKAFKNLTKEKLEKWLKDGRPANEDYAVLCGHNNPNHKNYGEIDLTKNIYSDDDIRNIYQIVHDTKLFLNFFIDESRNAFFEQVNLGRIKLKPFGTDIDEKADSDISQYLAFISQQAFSKANFLHNLVSKMWAPIMGVSGLVISAVIYASRHPDSELANIIFPIINNTIGLIPWVGDKIMALFLSAGASCHPSLPYWVGGIFMGIVAMLMGPLGISLYDKIRHYKPISGTTLGSRIFIGFFALFNQIPVLGQVWAGLGALIYTPFVFLYDLSRFWVRGYDSPYHKFGEGKIRMLSVLVLHQFINLVLVVGTLPFFVNLGDYATGETLTAILLGSFGLILFSINYIKNFKQKWINWSWVKKKETDEKTPLRQWNWKAVLALVSLGLLIWSFYVDSAAFRLLLGTLYIAINSFLSFFPAMEYLESLKGLFKRRETIPLVKRVKYSELPSLAQIFFTMNEQYGFSLGHLLRQSPLPETFETFTIKIEEIADEQDQGLLAKRKSLFNHLVGVDFSRDIQGIVDDRPLDKFVDLVWANPDMIELFGLKDLRNAPLSKISRFQFKRKLKQKIVNGEIQAILWKVYLASEDVDLEIARLDKMLRANQAELNANGIELNNKEQELNNNKRELAQKETALKNETNPQQKKKIKDEIKILKNIRKNMTKEKVKLNREAESLKRIVKLVSKEINMLKTEKTAGQGISLTNTEEVVASKILDWANDKLQTILSFELSTENVFKGFKNFVTEEFALNFGTFEEINEDAIPNDIQGGQDANKDLKEKIWQEKERMQKEFTELGLTVAQKEGIKEERKLAEELTLDRLQNIRGVGLAHSLAEKNKSDKIIQLTPEAPIGSWVAKAGNAGYQNSMMWTLAHSYNDLDEWIYLEEANKIPQVIGLFLSPYTDVIQPSHQIKTASYNDFNYASAEAFNPWDGLRLNTKIRSKHYGHNIIQLNEAVEPWGIPLFDPVGNIVGSVPILNPFGIVAQDLASEDHPTALHSMARRIAMGMGWAIYYAKLLLREGQEVKNEMVKQAWIRWPNVERWRSAIVGIYTSSKLLPWYEKVEELQGEQFYIRYLPALANIMLLPILMIFSDIAYMALPFMGFFAFLNSFFTQSISSLLFVHYIKRETSRRFKQWKFDYPIITFMGPRFGGWGEMIAIALFPIDLMLNAILKVFKIAYVYIGGSFRGMAHFLGIRVLSLKGLLISIEEVLFIEMPKNTPVYLWPSYLALGILVALIRFVWPREFITRTLIFAGFQFQANVSGIILSSLYNSFFEVNPKGPGQERVKTLDEILADSYAESKDLMIFSKIKYILAQAQDSTFWQDYGKMQSWGTIFLITLNLATGGLIGMKLNIGEPYLITGFLFSAVFQAIVAFCWIFEPILQNTLPGQSPSRNMVSVLGILGAVLLSIVSVGIVLMPQLLPIGFIILGSIGMGAYWLVKIITDRSKNTVESSTLRSNFGRSVFALALIYLFSQVVLVTSASYFGKEGVIMFRRMAIQKVEESMANNEKEKRLIYEITSQGEYMVKELGNIPQTETNMRNYDAKGFYPIDDKEKFIQGLPKDQAPEPVIIQDLPGINEFENKIAPEPLPGNDDSIKIILENTSPEIKQQPILQDTRNLIDISA
ncbi:MAG: hypothetical protein ABIG64_10030 [Candidatus Omnitrophota bacterium]